MDAHLVDPTFVEFGKLLLAVVLGMFLGTERMVAGKLAGTRTFALVALGSCLMVQMGQYVGGMYSGSGTFDMLRMAAAVAQGVGFICAGTIIFRDHMLRGLTTAAGLWVAAAVGMSVGFGLYGIAIFSTILTLGVFTGLWFFESMVRHAVVSILPPHTEEQDQELK